MFNMAVGIYDHMTEREQEQERERERERETEREKRERREREVLWSRENKEDHD